MINVIMSDTNENIFYKINVFMEFAKLQSLYLPLYQLKFSEWKRITYLFLFSFPLILEMFTVICCVIECYYFINDPNAYIFGVILILGFFITALKMLRLVQKSNEFLNLFDIIKDDFFKYKNDTKKFQLLKKNLNIFSNSFALFYIIFILFWVISPFFLKEFTVKNSDGNIVIYRRCIINIFIGVVSREFYEKMYMFIYVIEATVLIHMTVIGIVYEIIIINFCCIIFARLKAITKMYESFGWQLSIKNKCQKNAMCFAIYSCNWTDKNIQFKKLLLLSMKTCTANNLVMRITPTKYVNLALFASMMNLSYSIVSLLVKMLN
ncbi:uncharacterized protein LOC126894744 isoform X3 [Daktulosphaira vitifoliae]|uniref:uncharacterized protein LOC126894744 isoform X3 n=1 Tax=Daktulosphaira vitifoliae TaxID=58002 RepID=UPI0021AADEA6|nr:uncharacterized protein LOC126894744 isoform X3 [Daktulosphaira vitifoliae]